MHWVVDFDVSWVSVLGFGRVRCWLLVVSMLVCLWWVLFIVCGGYFVFGCCYGYLLFVDCECWCLR